MVKSSIILVSVLILPAVWGSIQQVTSNSTSSDCPALWKRMQNGSCVCGDSLDSVVRCDPTTKEVSILVYHCMTFSEELNQTLVGHCSTVNYYSGNGPYSDYYSLKGVRNISRDLNDLMCRYDKRCLNKSFNLCDIRNLQRTGLMCGACGEGYTPPVYSYSTACVKCTKEYKYNWLKYIAVAFLPLTVFYIIVVLFRITITSGSMNGLVLVSQIIASPIMERLLNRATDKPSVTTDIFTSAYGIWNLDFFRDSYTPFCLKPGMRTLPTLALDYLIAVYPIALIFISYILVKLHDNYRVIRWLWKPFNWCFSRIHHEWEIRSSLVAIFVTFLILSYVKILNVSFYLLTMNTLYDAEGNRLQTQFLYYDGTYKYFGKEHLPYAFLALFMFVVFNLIPLLLLCLYPCRCFHRCLNFCRVRSPALHIFMDTFHGCYNLEPRDCRWFAAFYLMLRLLNQIFVSISIGPFYLLLSAILFLVALVIVAIFRPYKTSAYVVVDIILLATLSAILFGIPGFRFIERYEPRSIIYFRAIASIAIFIPPFYGAGLLVYKLIPKKKFNKIKDKVLRGLQRQREEETLIHDYGLQQSKEYAPLLGNTSINQQCEP